MSEDIGAAGASALVTGHMSDRMSSRIAVVGGRCHFLNVTPRCSNVLTRYDAVMYSKHRKLQPTLASDGAASGLAEELAKLVLASPIALEMIAAALKSRSLEDSSSERSCQRCGPETKSADTTIGSDDPLVSLDVVKRITGIGKTRIYSLIRQRKFPKPYKPGGTSSRWSLAEVNCWRDEQRTQ